MRARCPKCQNIQVVELATGRPAPRHALKLFRVRLPKHHRRSMNGMGWVRCPGSRKTVRTRKDAVTHQKVEEET